MKMYCLQRQRAWNGFCQFHGKGVYVKEIMAFTENSTVKFRLSSSTKIFSNRIYIENGKTFSCFFSFSRYREVMKWTSTFEAV